MPSVLLGMAGLDAFDVDTEPQPPNGEFGEIVEAIWAGEGNAIVGPNGCRQAARDKKPFESTDYRVFTGGLKGLAFQQEA
jgi:hypothetical protein